MGERYKDIDLAFTRQPGATGTGDEPSYSGAQSFARRLYTKDLTGCDVAVVGVPLDLATTGRSGARYGPRAVRQGSTVLAWDRVWGWDFDPFDRLAVIDYGDVVFDHGRQDLAPGQIEEQFDEIHRENVATLMLGGDHFATYPVIKSLAIQIGEPLSLIHFDAHCDTWPDEKGRVDHGTMFYHAAKEGIIDPSTSSQIGIRTNNDDEEFDFNIITAEEATAQTPQAIAQAIKSVVKDRPVYLTFDIDCLDPSYAPGTGTPVPGGLTSIHALQILRGLAGVNIQSADVVEVAPAYDVSEVTALNGASIALNCLALMALSKRFNRA